MANTDNNTRYQFAEETFKRAFEYAAFGMVIIGTDGCLLQVNQAACTLFGYPAEELILKSFQDLTHPDDLEVGVELFQDILAGRRDYGWLEKRYVRKDGSVIWTLLSTTMIRDQEGAPLYLVSQIQDITERKRAEISLAEKEAEYRSIFEATMDGLIINRLDGTIVEVNPAFSRMHGYSREELFGLHPTVFIHPDDHVLFEEYLQTVKAGDIFIGQAINVRKDGTQLHVEVHGTPFMYRGIPHILGVVRDITEQVRFHQMLEERINTRTNELLAIYDVTAVSSTSHELEQVLDKSLSRVLEVMGCEIGSIHLLDKTKSNLRLAAWHGTPHDIVKEIEIMPLGYGVAGRVIDHNGPLVVPSIEQDPNTVPKSGHLLAGHAYIGTPMRAKGIVVGVLSIIGLEARMFNKDEIALLSSIGDLIGVAVENARLYEQGEALAVAEERQRLAREIHDTLAQGFTGIKLQLDAVESALEIEDHTLVLERLKRARILAEQSLAEARRSVWALRSQSLSHKSLGDALRDSVRGLTDGSGLGVTFEIDEEPLAFPLELQTDILRVTQEAVMNVVKHARAANMHICLVYKSGMIEMRIDDDGRGFSMDHTRNAGGEGGGFGLIAMRERIARHRGKLQIDSYPRRGTHIKASIEFEPEGV